MLNTHNDKTSRRNFLAFSAASLVAALPLSSTAALRNDASAPYPISSTPPPQWNLWLQRQSTGEEYKEIYVNDGVLNIPGYNNICHALRDVRAPASEQVVQIDIKLLNLLFAAQQWMKINNQYRPLVITSGYRTQRSNAQLERAAYNSMHIHGKACDFYIDGLPSKYLADLVQWFQEGGVGFYASKHFVHADTGRVRHWLG